MPATRPRPYTGPPRYPATPRWGFVPSVWRVAASVNPARTVPAPARDLKSVVVLARATAAVGLIAAGTEAFRYVLLVRGRTEVLPVNQVRWSDAMVMSAGWAVVLMALATALTLVPAIGRTEAWARQRHELRPTRSAARRLLWLLVPGANLYGAGVVLAEIDATLRMPLPEVPATPEPDRLRWTSGQLPDLAAPVAPAETPSVVTPPPVHRTPGRLIGWWWTAWVLSGLLVAVAAVWSLNPGSLQARANLVELHVVIDLVAAAVALLTAAVARSWIGLMESPVVDWPDGWVLAPPAQAATGRLPTTPPASASSSSATPPAQAIGSAASPSPTTESVRAASPLVTTQSTE